MLINIAQEAEWILNYRGFASIDSRLASVEQTLEVIERDLKRFYESQAEIEKEIARLKDHTGLK